MKNKRVVITGSNSGIGKQIAIEIAKKGAEVVMVCRSQERAENARKDIIKESKNDNILIELCDFSSQKSIKETGELMREKYDKIDVLINNAGAIFGTHQLNEDGLERTFALNHMGYFYFTHYMLDLVKEGENKRIVSTASYAHNFIRNIPWDDLQLENMPYRQLHSYGLSKLYNIYFTKYLAAKLAEEKTGITANCVHPGTVYSGFGKEGTPFFYRLFKIAKPFFDNTQQGARTPVYLATSPELEGVTGIYYAHMKKAKITNLAKNRENATRLWDISKEILSIEEYGKV